MANLTQFLGLSASTGASSLTVFPTDRGGSVSNGGRCCCYIIDGSTTRVHVELWGSGGDGSGACCCQWPYNMASPGQYVTKSFTVAAGDYLTICAGSSGTCSPNCCGNAGAPSFVNLNGSPQAYAYGGNGGCAMCFYKTFNCTGICEPARRVSCSGTGDFVGCQYSGMSVSHNFCHTGNFEAVMGSPKYSQNNRLTASNCAVGQTVQGCDKNCNHFPAGSGASGSSCGGGCCWGGWGAGGMVVLTFYG